MAKPALEFPARVRPRDLLKLTNFPIHPFDEMHGVDTSGLVPAAHLTTGHPNDEHVTAYYGVAPSILRTLVEQWRETLPPYPPARYSFVDIGAGKGRAMLVASELGFRKVIGIELNPAMAAIARKNVELWREGHEEDATAPKLAPMEVREQDALELKFPRTPTLVFLFHPFDAPVLRLLLRRVEAQFAKRPGTLDILYVNAECADVLDRHPAFRQCSFFWARWRCRRRIMSPIWRRLRSKRNMGPPATRSARSTGTWAGLPRRVRPNRAGGPAGRVRLPRRVPCRFRRRPS